MRDRAAWTRRMLGLASRWQGSGMSVSAYARANDVTRDTLMYWLRRGGGRRRSPGAARRQPRAEDVTFAPVQVVGPERAAMLEVTLADGMRLVFDRSASPELVAAALKAARSKC